MPGQRAGRAGARVFIGHLHEGKSQPDLKGIGKMLDECEAALKEQTKQTKKEVGAQEIEMAIDEA